MSTRTDERTEFLSDVIITAIEGGVTYWATVTAYAPVLDPAPGSTSTATVQDRENGLTEHEITVETVARGLARIRDEHRALGNRSRLVQADRENDAGNIDAYDADALVQLGLFGETRYA